MELMNLSCEGFLEELASKAAAPGGGGASALIFSLSGGLLAFVVMWALFPLEGKRLSAAGISVAGAAAHTRLVGGHASASCMVSVFSRGRASDPNQ